MAPKCTRHRSSIQKTLFALLFATFFFSSERSSGQCTATLTVNATSSCQDSTFSLTASPSGLYDYQWFVNGNLGPLGIEVWNYYAFQPGTYTFEVQITDFNNCTVISNPVTITVYPNPNIQCSSNGNVCPGGTLQLNATSNTGTSYTWSGPNGFTATTQNPTLSNFQAVNAGTYYVYSTFNGCNSYIDHVQVDTVSSTPSITAILNQYYGYQNSICEGESFSLSTSIAGFTSGSLLWTGPGGFSSSSNLNFINNSTVADSGLYTVTYTGATCAGTQTVSDTAWLHVNTAPITSVSNNGPICAGSTLQLTATGPGGVFDWSGPNSFTNNTSLTPSITNAQPNNSGTYTIHAILGNCEMWETTNVTVMSNTPSFNLYGPGNNIKCAGDHINMFVNNVTNMTGPSYLWTGPNYTSTQQFASYTIVNHMLDSGMYYIDVTGTGCTGTVTVTDSFLVDVRPCVWPGDVNNDLITDNFDVLDLGLGYGALGPNRPNANYNWEGQYMTDWAQMQFCNQDMKFADCNGNGIITASDTFGIALNYSQTHLKGNEYIPVAKSASNPDLYFDMTGITLTPGSIVSIPIKLGTSSIPMVNVYGLAAQIKVTGITPVNGMTIDAPAGWMGSIADALNFTKYISNNQTDWAYVRTDHNNASGDGLIAVLEFEVPAGTQYQQVHMYFDNVRIIGNTGNVITTVNIMDDTATIYPTTLTGTSVYISDAMVIPNPSDAQASLQVTTAQDGKIQVNITDITGRKVWNTTANTVTGVQQIALPADVASGMYNVEVKDERGAVAKTMKWVKK